MFFDIYRALCESKGVSPSAAAVEMGINKGTVSVWKNKGTTPQTQQLQKMAEYFGVSVDYLLTGTQETPPAEAEGAIRVTEDDFTYAMYNEGKELTDEDKRTLLEMAQFLKNRKKKDN